MNTTVVNHGVQQWDAVLSLQDELARIERRNPGCREACIVEDAISLLVDGRLSRSKPEYARRDALRRSRFLYFQAERKRRAAAIRLGRPEQVPLDDDEEVFEMGGRGASIAPDRFDRLTPEQIVCFEESVFELVITPYVGAGRTDMGPVVGLLLAGFRPDEVACALGVSRSTIDRRIALVRAEAMRLVHAVAA